MMTLPMRAAEEAGRAWAEACWRAVRAALEKPRTQADYDWALGFADGYLRKLTRKASSQAIITLSAALLQEAGLEGAERVLLLPLPEGGLLLRPATDEDVSKAHARYSAGPQPCFAAKPTPEDLPEVERFCPQCGLTFLTRQQRRVYCDGCKHQRGLEQQRAWFGRRGKLAPSYRRRAKRRELASGSYARGAEPLRLRFADETCSGTDTRTPAAGARRRSRGSGSELR
jgi:hypothetical protein